MDRYKKGVIPVDSAKEIFKILGHVFDQDNYHEALDKINPGERSQEYLFSSCFMWGGALVVQLLKC